MAKIILFNHFNIASGSDQDDVLPVRSKVAKFISGFDSDGQPIYDTTPRPNQNGDMPKVDVDQLEWNVLTAESYQALNGNVPDPLRFLIGAAFEKGGYTTKTTVLDADNPQSISGFDRDGQPIWKKNYITIKNRTQTDDVDLNKEKIQFYEYQLLQGSSGPGKFLITIDPKKYKDLTYEEEQKIAFNFDFAYDYITKKNQWYPDFNFMINEEDFDFEVKSVVEAYTPYDIFQPEGKLSPYKDETSLSFAYAMRSIDPETGVGVNTHLCQNADLINGAAAVGDEKSAVSNENDKITKVSELKNIIVDALTPAPKTGPFGSVAGGQDGGTPAISEVNDLIPKHGGIKQGKIDINKVYNSIRIRIPKRIDDISAPNTVDAYSDITMKAAIGAGALSELNFYDYAIMNSRAWRASGQADPGTERYSLDTYYSDDSGKQPLATKNIDSTTYAAGPYVTFDSFHMNMFKTLFNAQNTDPINVFRYDTADPTLYISNNVELGNIKYDRELRWQDGRDILDPNEAKYVNKIATKKYLSNFKPKRALNTYGTTTIMRDETWDSPIIGSDAFPVQYKPNNHFLSLYQSTYVGENAIFAPDILKNGAASKKQQEQGLFYQPYEQVLLDIANEKQINPKKALNPSKLIGIKVVKSRQEANFNEKDFDFTSIFEPVQTFYFSVQMTEKEQFVEFFDSQIIMDQTYFYTFIGVYEVDGSWYKYIDVELEKYPDMKFSDPNKPAIPGGFKNIEFGWWTVPQRRIVEVPLAPASIRSVVINWPPLAPNVKFSPLEGVDNHIDIFFNETVMGEPQLFPTIYDNNTGAVVDKLKQLARYEAWYNPNDLAAAFNRIANTDQYGNAVRDALAAQGFPDTMAQAKSAIDELKDLDIPKLFSSFKWLSEIEYPQTDNARLAKLFLDTALEVAMYHQSQGDLKIVRAFRLDRKPESYADLIENGLITDLQYEKQQRSYRDNIEPNTKYYYTFISQDISGLYSPPCEIYEVELVEDSGFIYPVINVPELSELFVQKQKPKLKKDFSQYLKIEPSIKQKIVTLLDKPPFRRLGPAKSEETVYTAANVKDLELVGASGIDVDNYPIIKVRVRSKKTKRAFDLNIKYIVKLVDGEEKRKKLSPNAKLIKRVIL